MTMVGLFWITDHEVYVGSPPGADGTGLRLTDDAVQTLGTTAPRTFAWWELRAIELSDVPVRTTSRRLSVAVEGALSVAFGGMDDPPPMTVQVESASGAEEFTLYAVSASGHSETERDLSQALLNAFLAGDSSPGLLMAWRRRHGEGNPRSAQREALLREWIG
ncbi:hypothetical protein [Streptomyces sp. NBC_01304]|uniref:hypothetical protein n=1 Tax=Streptomyces sp. NBC_01304 TaxID=2903818 RepID=UPI002E1309E8|nr:hypothetical protein OG430_23855 [Streptomyces sp. NBC_01304]